MKIKLKLKSVSYTGKSVGRDILIEIKVLDRTLPVDKRIKPGSTVEIDKEIGTFSVDQEIFEAIIELRVTEKDFIFSDSGKTSQTLRIEISKAFPQQFEYQVIVQERRAVFWKSTAIFKIFLEAEAEYIDPTVDNPKWTGNFRDDSPEMILARALFGEARSALNAAKTAVAWVIRNRVEHPRHRWGKTYHDVILQKEHFSAFNQSDPNRPFVENPFHTENEIDKKAWLSCYEVANLVIKGEDPDPTGGANHYYSDSRYGPPFWATKATFKVKIGPFYFHEL